MSDSDSTTLAPTVASEAARWLSITLGQYEGMDLRPEELQDLLMKIWRYCVDHYPEDSGGLFDALRNAMVEILYPDRRRDWYHAYLQTEYWKAMREWKLCGQSGWQVHHRVYDHLGHEDPRELLVLCGECHKTWMHRK